MIELNQPVKVIREGLYKDMLGTVEARKGDKFLIKFKETATYFQEHELEILGPAEDRPSKIRTLFKGLPNTR